MIINSLTLSLALIGRSCWCLVPFTIPLDIGVDGLLANLTTGSQTFSMLLDTGSSETWIRGPNCKSTGSDSSCSGPKLNTNVPTFLPTHKTFGFIYGVGKVQGDIYTASVSIYGIPTFLAVGSTTFETKQSGIDGIIGLSFSNYSTITHSSGLQSNFIDSFNLTDQHNLFSTYISDNDELNQSELCIGGYNPEKFSGSIAWVPVEIPVLNQKDWSISIVGWWVFDVTDVYVSVSGARPLPKIPIGTTNAPKAFVDNGSGDIFLDSKVADAINSAIGAKYDKSQDGYLLPCSFKNSAPSVTFHISGVSINVTPINYVSDIGLDDGQCLSLFTGGAESNYYGILGFPFLQAAYTIHSKSYPPRLGFAQALHIRK
ncbi:hypothetical protein HDV04_005329 [Boothiomyces sp. JEL0838]|nr:hypothetical protein HDV04_005329 [Boothiomyces sp. JEL0838]